MAHAVLQTRATFRGCTGEDERAARVAALSLGCTMVKGGNAVVNKAGVSRKTAVYRERPRVGANARSADAARRCDGFGQLLIDRLKWGADRAHLRRDIGRANDFHRVLYNLG